MNFAIKITYTDDKALDIILPEAEVPRFVESVQKGECYWDKSNQSAFWTKDNLIRYMNLNKIPEEQPKAAVEEIEDAKKEEKPPQKKEVGKK